MRRMRLIRPESPAIALAPQSDLRFGCPTAQSFRSAGRRFVAPPETPRAAELYRTGKAVLGNAITGFVCHPPPAVPV